MPNSLPATPHDASRRPDAPPETQEPRTYFAPVLGVLVILVLVGLGIVLYIDHAPSLVPGRDADQNGIRDDVDAYLEAEYGEGTHSTPAERLAATYAALALQAALVDAASSDVGPPTSPEDAPIHTYKKAHRCFAYVADEQVLGLSADLLKEETLTTPARQRAFDAAIELGDLDPFTYLHSETDRQDDCPTAVQALAD